MICPVCGAVFCYDDGDQLLAGSNPKVYCGDTCKRRAGARRAAQRQRQDAAMVSLAAKLAPGRA